MSNHTHEKPEKQNGRKKKPMRKATIGIVALAVLGIVTGIILWRCPRPRPIIGWLTLTYDTEADEAHLPQAVKTTIDVLSRRLEKAGYSGVAVEQSPGKKAGVFVRVPLDSAYEKLVSGPLDPTGNPVTNLEPVVEPIRQLLEMRGALSFHQVVPETDPRVEGARQQGKAPKGYMLLPQKPRLGRSSENRKQLLLHETGVSGRIVRTARAEPDEGWPYWNVWLVVTDEASKASDVLATRLYHPDYEKAGRIAIVVDGVILSTPVFRAPKCGDRVMIPELRMREAKRLAIVLNAGSLPFKLVWRETLWTEKKQ